MAEIFICYRRTDSEGHTGRLHDHLQEHFGARAVFVDVDNLHPGVDFEEVIQRTLLKSTVVLVVIGPRWLDQRLKNETDYVRREIIAALKGKKRLIPVLVGDAKMPSRNKLPPELSALAGRNGVTLRHATWKADVIRLLTSLERILGRKKAASKAASPSVPQPSKPKGARETTPRRKATDNVSAADKATKGKTSTRTKSPVTKKASPRSKTTAEPAKSTPPRQPSKEEVPRRGAAKPSNSRPGQQVPQSGNRSVSGKTPSPGGKKLRSNKSTTGTSTRPTKR